MKSFPKLRGRIVEKYGSQILFANAIGKTNQTVTNKLTGKSEFSKNDIVDWCTALEIDKEDVGEFFFVDEL